MNQKDNHHRKKIIALFLIIIAVTAIVALLFLVFTPKETYVSNTNQTNTIESLYCSSDNPTDPFFISDKANSSKHEIKITFIDGLPDKMNYTYTGNFESEDTAKSALSILQGNYNIYMAGTNIRQDSLYPSFSTIDTSGIINLYLQKKTLTPETIKFMFLSPNEYADINDYSMESFREIYEIKNFICK